jgi:hypothetical protein
MLLFNPLFGSARQPGEWPRELTLRYSHACEWLIQCNLMATSHPSWLSSHLASINCNLCSPHCFHPDVHWNVQHLRDLSKPDWASPLKSFVTSLPIPVANPVWVSLANVVSHIPVTHQYYHPETPLVYSTRRTCGTSQLIRSRGIACTTFTTPDP